ncbi:hypothetical protein G9H64_00630 [Aquirufa nivalisilvae]|uniref:hypothetical protein n=1 Tax=Aquirufa nivalisilvae TaxID=2516557 RepID=UPI0022A98AAB|nr:hypothetical protein [Aquirufa nivalisilvae]MCZ2481445.1 hypothetical protein [Aquirufa nivalisilvae]
MKKFISSFFLFILLFSASCSKIENSEVINSDFDKKTLTENFSEISIQLRSLLIDNEELILENRDKISNIYNGNVIAFLYSIGKVNQISRIENKILEVRKIVRTNPDLENIILDEDFGSEVNKWVNYKQQILKVSPNKVVLESNSDCLKIYYSMQSACNDPFNTALFRALQGIILDLAATPSGFSILTLGLGLGTGYILYDYYQCHTQADDFYIKCKKLIQK